MPKFTIKLQKTVTFIAEATITAESQREAEILSDVVVYQSFDWNYVDDDIEVMSVNER